MRLRTLGASDGMPSNIFHIKSQNLYILEESARGCYIFNVRTSSNEPR